ncbi:SprT family zinc-dependent metalloprotease [Herbivorax sp. ANBcel31]|uniref:M48 family metallopeptidase n=1 Tax=Herbivorax sp. ANBcel31 TaxID=3069754 RepID=UPI0027AF8BC5|nr:SprT family zinc-dependent metalloprotease [Herbivorax sp. ANBcel31]MDQ2087472.1 SprT family zinc-dependent metalloprotease [Herbivorax sp. ANBcel31]
MDVTLDGVKIQYELVRSNRKTVAIKLSEDGNIKVSAPFGVTQNQIDEIIKDKLSWILKKQQELKKLYREKNVKRTFENGERISYLGKEYFLEIVEVIEDSKPKVVINDGNMVIYINERCIVKDKSREIRNIIKMWLVERFRDIAIERIEKYKSIIRVSPKKITIREQKTRWGSCSSKGSINLNWKLVMAPMEVLDYVIVHELCHMREMNHSKNYWKIVSSIMPDYTEHRKWLKENGHKLGI